MCHIGEVSPLEVARETTEVRVDWKGGELVLIITHDSAVYHQVIHSHTHKGSTNWGLKHCTTCMHMCIDV